MPLRVARRSSVRGNAVGGVGVTVDTSCLLIARAVALQDEIGRVERLLAQASEVHLGRDGIDPHRYVELATRFKDILYVRRTELSNLIEAGRAEHAGPELWEELEEVRGNCVAAFGECLEFCQGTISREEGFDGGGCHTADHLLDGIATAARVDWHGLTIMGESEVYGDMAGIITLRFPQDSLWHLPIAAHEFGHFAGPEMGLDRYTELRKFERGAAKGVADEAPEKTFPIREILRREWEKGSQIRWSYVYELFADMFATYALGPSYAYTCVYLRFDPGSAKLRTREHPSPAERMDVVLRTLRQMDHEADIAIPLDPELSGLEETWRESVSSAGVDPELTEKELDRLSPIWSRFYALLRDRPSDLPYATFGRARVVADELQSGQVNRQCEPRRDALADVLNGAWMAAAAHWSEPTRVRQIGARAQARIDELVRSDQDQV
jgi:hypothetical protein